MPSQLQPVPIPPPSGEVDAYFANLSNEDLNYDADTELRVEEIELLCINIHCALRTYQVATALWQTPFATTSSYSSVIQSARLLV